MLENTKNEFKTTIVEMFGERTIDGKCKFCGEDLTNEKYCYCVDAQKINSYYRKVSKRISDFDWTIQAGNEKNYIKNLVAYAGVPNRYKGKTFDDFDGTLAADAQIKKSVMNYYLHIIENYITGRNLILIGNFGTGKTLLMSILVNAIVFCKGLSAKYINGVELINEIQDTYSNNKRSTLCVTNEYRNADFLFIDDLDKINATPDARKLIYSIVNDRYDRQMPTIISANSSVEVLDAEYFGEAVISRLVENSTLIQFSQKNKRY